jgi:hypothetical protein
MRSKITLGFLDNFLNDMPCFPGYEGTADRNTFFASTNPKPVIPLYDVTTNQFDTQRAPRMGANGSIQA